MADSTAQYIVVVAVYRESAREGEARGPPLSFFEPHTREADIARDCV